MNDLPDLDQLEPFESEPEPDASLPPSPPGSFFDRVAAELRKAGHDAQAVMGKGGLPVLAVPGGPGEGSWAFGTASGLLWGGDYYDPHGHYYDSLELKVRADEPDAGKVAAAILLRLATPVEAVPEDEITPPE
jgi:hypothetical protein